MPIQKKLLWAAGVIAAALLAGVAVFFFIKAQSQTGMAAPTNFFECAERYKVTEGSPRRCKAGWGKTFYEYQGNELQKQNLIRATSFSAAEVIESSPLTFSGQAHGSWFFEGTFPVELQANGRTIGEGTAEATSDGITGEYVPFEATISFTQPSAMAQGALILKKANPSGDDKNNDALVIPVVF